MYQGQVKAMWLIKRHANDDSHKVKAGWYLDGANEVLVSKPKSEPNHILVAENLHSTRPIFVSSTLIYGVSSPLQEIFLWISTAKNIYRIQRSQLYIVIFSILHSLAPLACTSLLGFSLFISKI